MNEWVKVGKVKDAHGLKGDLYVLIFSGDCSWLPKLAQVQLGPKVFEVVSAKKHKDGISVKLKGVLNRTQAEALKGLFFFIEDHLLVSQAGEAIFLSEIKSFAVEDEKFGPLGVVTGFSSNTAQDIIEITGAKGNIEVPFVADFIVEIDYQKKLITMKLPEGILEINAKN